MFNHWLKPISPDLFTDLEEWHFGKKITHYTEGGNLDLKTTSIAIVGINEAEADAVRAILYSLSFPFTNLSITDLGNMRKQDPSFIIPLLTELLQSDIVPVIIGQSETAILPQFQAFHARKNSVNLTLIDEKIRFSPFLKEGKQFLQAILEDSHLFNLSFIGFQSHYTDPSVISLLEKRHFELIRLGKLRADIEDIEPIIRDADLVSFNLAAMKMNEAPGQINGTPSGLTAEEACQIARYAGMSDKLTSFGIYGFHKKYDSLDQATAQIVAQMVWYFTEGFQNRKQDFPIQKAFNQLTQYIVDVKAFDERLTFWRSNKSGRWWMEIPVKTRKKHTRHRLIPCSYNDYLQACKDDLPDRLILAYQRFM
jgi:formiminoglutamase